MMKKEALLDLKLGRHELGDAIPKVARIYHTESREPTQPGEGRAKRCRETETHDSISVLNPSQYLKSINYTFWLFYH